MAPVTKLTPEVREKLMEALLAGNYRQKAAQFADISNRTLSYWIAKGQQDPTTPEGQLVLDILNAESQAELRMVTTIHAAARKDWKAAAWWLERKFPKRWGRKNNFQQPEGTAANVPLTVNLNVQGAAARSGAPEDEVPVAAANGESETLPN